MRLSFRRLACSPRARPAPREVALLLSLPLSPRPLLLQRLPHSPVMSATLTQSVTDTLDKVGKLKLSGEEASQSTPTGQEEKRRAEASGYKYAHLLPEWHTSLKLPPLEPFEHVDPGHQALKDPAPRSFLEGAAVRDITPNVGTEVTDGVDLTKLDARARSQLALFVAQRGVVVFKNQQAFIDSDPRWQIDDWGSFFGRIHIHPVSGYAKEFPEFHLVWREESGTSDERTYEGRINNLTVHSDVTYEVCPALSWVIHLRLRGGRCGLRSSRTS